MCSCLLLTRSVLVATLVSPNHDPALAGLCCGWMSPDNSCWAGLKPLQPQLSHGCSGSTEHVGAQCHPDVPRGRQISGVVALVGSKQLLTQISKASQAWI